jgi:hypothetical protein
MEMEYPDVPISYYITHCIFLFIASSSFYITQDIGGKFLSGITTITIITSMVCSPIWLDGVRHAFIDDSGVIYFAIIWELIIILMAITIFYMVSYISCESEKVRKHTRRDNYRSNDIGDLTYDNLDADNNADNDDNNADNSADGNADNSADGNADNSADGNADDNADNNADNNACSNRMDDNEEKRILKHLSNKMMKNACNRLIDSMKNE